MQIFISRLFPGGRQVDARRRASSLIAYGERSLDISSSGGGTVSGSSSNCSSQYKDSAVSVADCDPEDDCVFACLVTMSARTTSASREDPGLEDVAGAPEAVFGALNDPVTGMAAACDLETGLVVRDLTTLSAGVICEPHLPTGLGGVVSLPVAEPTVLGLADPLAGVFDRPFVRVGGPKSRTAFVYPGGRCLCPLNGKESPPVARQTDGCRRTGLDVDLLTCEP